MLLSRARLVWAVILLSTLAAVAAAYAYTQYLSQDHYMAGLGRIDAYSIGEQQTVLTIYFTVGYGDVAGDASVTEDSQAVTVKVNTSVLVPGRGRFKNLAGYFRQATVTLTRPLGERVVIDGGTGKAVPPSPAQR
jgi:hypothetical protein